VVERRVGFPSGFRSDGVDDQTTDALAFNDAL